MKNYTHFAIYKPENKIILGWAYKGISPEELRQYKNEYFYNDLIGNGFNSKDVAIWSRGKCLRSGLNPDDGSSWSCGMDKHEEGELNEGLLNEVFASSILNNLVRQHGGVGKVNSRGSDENGKAAIMPIDSLSDNDIRNCVFRVGNNFYRFSQDGRFDKFDGNAKYGASNFYIYFKDGSILYIPQNILNSVAQARNDKEQFRRNRNDAYQPMTQAGVASGSGIRNGVKDSGDYGRFWQNAANRNPYDVQAQQRLNMRQNMISNAKNHGEINTWNRDVNGRNAGFANIHEGMLDESVMRARLKECITEAMDEIFNKQA